jgi:hydroxylamine dehydrogenase
MTTYEGLTMVDHPARGVTWVVGMVLVIVMLAGATAAAPASAGPADATATAIGDEAVASTSDTVTADSQDAPVTNVTKRCIACHEDNHPGMVKQFKESAHYDAGISCLDCHSAKPSDTTAEEHFGNVISPIVTPKDCEECHAEEVTEFQNSLHNEAGMFSASAISNTETGAAAMPTGWNNNIKTHNSRASAEAGCVECHGANLRVLNPNTEEAVEDVKIQGHPNQGIGRFNPDGSLGTCAACHPQHRFSIEQARASSGGGGGCVECHLGPDHPQREIYEESKHSTMFEANHDEFNLSVPADELSAEDITAPTCSVCHMSGLGGAEPTHDVSSRLKWEAEPVYSWPTSKQYETGEERYPIDDAVARHYEDKYGLENGTLESVPTGAPNPFSALETHRPDLYEEYVVENNDTYSHIDAGDEPTRWDAYGGESKVSAQQKRERMKKVCTACHTEEWVNADFVKRDNVIDIYNAVYMAAGEKYYDDIKDQAPKATPYDQSWVDSIYFEMWHHEGRRWRMGALMKGQDWSHWEGAYLVKNDVLKLAHFQAVYENTDVGGNMTDTTESPSIDETAPSDVGQAQPPIAERLPTGLAGVGLGAVGALLLAGAFAVSMNWRRRF